MQLSNLVVMQSKVHRRSTYGRTNEVGDGRIEFRELTEERHPAGLVASPCGCWAFFCRFWGSWGLLPLSRAKSANDPPTVPRSSPIRFLISPPHLRTAPDSPSLPPIDLSSSTQGCYTPCKHPQTARFDTPPPMPDAASSPSAADSAAEKKQKEKRFLCATCQRAFARLEHLQVILSAANFPCKKV